MDDAQKILKSVYGNSSSNDEANNLVFDQKNGVTVKGDEFGEYKDLRDLRQKAAQYYRENLQGTSVYNPILGKIDIDENGIVNFTSSGRKEMKNTSAKENKLLLVKYLPKLIKNATDIASSESIKEKHDGDYFYYLHTNSMIGNEIIPVDITLIKRPNGDIQYYNHILPSEEKQKDTPVSSRSVSPNGALDTKTFNVSSIGDSIPQNDRNVKVFDQAIANQIKGQAIIKQNEAVIKLLDKADASTLMHEAAHVYLQQLYTLASFEGVDEQTKKDFNTLARWLDYDPKQGKLTTKQQEKFARGFEAYLRTGQTQVKNLKGVFNRFKQWLSDIYKTFKELGGKPSKEVRDVMERMVATDSEIKQAQGEAAVAKANERKTTQYWEKAVKKAYPKFSKEFRDSMADILVWMQSGMGQGVSSALVYDQEGQGYNVIARLTSSNNDPWYQEWYAQNHKKPNIGEQIWFLFETFNAKTASIMECIINNN